MAAAPALTLAAFGAGLVATVVLAAWCTPRSWWRRANARALAVLAAGTFGIGSLLLWFVDGAAPAAAAPRHAAAPMDGPVAGASYRTWDDLNVRESRSVNARRLAVVPAGASVTATGARMGDWWQVSARVQGREVRGWASSLWLRRADEAR
jgi:hypothetical protein